MSIIDPMDYSDPQSVARLAQGEHPPKVEVEVGLLVAALDHLGQYSDYASEMRKLGRGFYPDDGYGLGAENVRQWILKHLEQAQAKAVKP